ncbi:hypothetical protein R9X47_01745 [Wukongibacter baidiensis]|uniref:hypothetical protein n=1 Tax=Wukongibacter baidiensis TaxID=1723361 RepID=UPI003D7FE8BE
MNERERTNILQRLSLEQRKFLEENIKQLKCNIWVEKLAKLKGITITDDMNEETLQNKLDDWILVDVLDGGYKQRPYKCVCGKSLRRQYILKNNNKDITLKLGQECLKNYTKLNGDLVNDIIRGFYKVNSELDDILDRHSKGLASEHKKYLNEPSLLATYKAQIDLDLPLSQRQESKTKQLIEEHHNNELMDGLKEIEEKLSADQKKFINTVINKDDKYQLMIRLKNGDYIHKLEDIKDIRVSDIVEQKIRLRLPLSAQEENNISLKKILKSSNYGERNSFANSIPAKNTMRNDKKKSRLCNRVASSDLEEGIGLLDKLGTSNITSKEAEELFYFIKKEVHQLGIYNTDLKEVKKRASKSLGRISNYHVRRWLVEIKGLK